MFSHNLGRVNKPYWLTERIVNKLGVEAVLGSCEKLRLAKLEIIARFGAYLIVLVVALAFI